MLSLLLAAGLSVSGPAEQVVQCHEVAFSRSAQAHNVEAFRAFLDEDVRFATGIPTLKGPDGVVAGWAGLLGTDSPNIRWWPDSVEVREDGKLALSQGPYELSRTTDEGTSLSSGRYISTWQKQADGGWKIIFDTGTGSTPIDTPLDSPWTDEVYAAKCTASGA